MAKAFVIIKDIDLDMGSPRFVYSVTVPSSPQPRFGGDCYLNPAKTLTDNLAEVRRKVARQVCDHGCHITEDDIEHVDTLRNIESEGSIVDRAVAQTRRLFSSSDSTKQAELDAKVESHSILLQEYREYIQRFQDAIQGLETKVQGHDHPYPERAAQLETEVKGLQAELEEMSLNHTQQIEQLHQMILDLTPEPEPVIDQVVIDEPISEPSTWQRVKNFFKGE